jgi:hypothetical protein
MAGLPTFGTEEMMQQLSRTFNKAPDSRRDGWAGKFPEDY